MRLGNGIKEVRDVGKMVPEPRNKGWL